MSSEFLMDLYFDLIKSTVGKDLTPEEICDIFAKEFQVQITPQELLQFQRLTDEGRDKLIHNKLIQLRYG